MFSSEWNAESERVGSTQRNEGCWRSGGVVERSRQRAGLVGRVTVRVTAIMDTAVRSRWLRTQRWMVRYPNGVVSSGRDDTHSAAAWRFECFFSGGGSSVFTVPHRSRKRASVFTAALGGLLRILLSAKRKCLRVLLWVAGWHCVKRAVWQRMRWRVLA